MCGFREGRLGHVCDIRAPSRALLFSDLHFHRIQDESGIRIVEEMGASYLVPYNLCLLLWWCKGD